MEDTMNVKGKIVEVYEEGVATFKVATKLGFAFVWVWDEVEVNFRSGMEFEVEEAPVTFHDGYPVAVIKPGVFFYLDDHIYDVRERVR